MKAANRVAFNTGVLYIKMGVDIVLTLYSARLILGALGASDFGIYSLVVGVVAMLAFFNGAMATSTGRYFSFSRGSGNIKKLNEVFNTSILLHGVIGIAIVVFAEASGLLMFESILNIPADRLSTAKVIFHIVVATTFITILYIPYDALLQARENLLVDSILGILNSSLRFILAIYLTFSPYDRLIVYAIGVGFLELSIKIIKQIYCRRYSESRINTALMGNRGLIREIGSFAGWNTLNAGCMMIKNQGLAIVLNVFHGTIINAAYGIANRISSQLLIFSVTVIKAIYPQIIKAEGAGNRIRMLELSMTASKIAFFLMAVFAIPIIAEMPMILQLWLKEVPENTIVFSRLAIIGILLNTITVGLQVAVQAVGLIKLYSISTGLILLMNLPVGYLLLKKEYPAYSILVSAAIIEFIVCIVRIKVLKRICDLPDNFYWSVIVRIMPSVMAASAISYALLYTMEPSIIRMILSGFGSLVAFGFLGYFVGCGAKEKSHITGVGMALFNKSKSLISGVG